MGEKIFYIIVLLTVKLAAVKARPSTIVFRKASKPARNWPSGQGQVVAAHFSKSDPLLFLLSGRWLGDAFRRLRRASRDSMTTPNPSKS